jgi:hypothetical protein
VDLRPVKAEDSAIRPGSDPKGDLIGDVGDVGLEFAIGGLERSERQGFPLKNGTLRAMLSLSFQQRETPTHYPPPSWRPT